jgi:GT2 family glycosyltransferase
MGASVPKVSIIWLNFNTGRSLDKVKESLRGIANLRYDNYELIIVDNGSTDGSFPKISDHAGNLGIPTKLVSAGKNLGFTGGNNLGLRHASPESKYIALMNSDYVPFEQSLSHLVTRMESDNSIGEARLPELDWSGKRMQSAGHFLDELLNLYPRFSDSAPASVPAREISYASAEYCVVRREITNQLGRLFDENIFIYWEDTLLSFEIWNLGYKVVCLEEPGGRHFGTLVSDRTSFFARSNQIYGLGYFLGATNSRFRLGIEMATSSLALELSISNNEPGWLDSFLHGFRKGEKRPRLDLYKAPIRKSELSGVLNELIKYPIARPVAHLVSPNFGRIFRSTLAGKRR